MLGASDVGLTAAYDVAVLDLDGVVYVGPDAVPGAPEALNAAQSGGMHLADGLGTPAAVVFAGTERPGDIAPRNVPVALLGVRVPCSPCRLLTCPYETQCLDVPPERVAAAAAGLARTAVRPSAERVRVDHG